MSTQKENTELAQVKEQNEVLRDMVADQSNYVEKLLENRGLMQKIFAECRDFMMKQDLSKKDKHLLQIVHYCIDDSLIERQGVL